MARFALDRHAAVAALVAAVALAVPAFGGADSVRGSATSVTARAASVEDGAGAAERFPVDGPSMQTAVRVSSEHWGAPACGGDVALAWVPMDAGTNGTASWRNPTDAWNNPDTNFDCRIELNSAIEFDWEKLCSVVAHEIGHLRGQQHAAGPGELMSAVYSGPLGVCARTADPAAPAPAPAPTRAAAEPQAPAERRSSTPRGAVAKKIVSHHHRVSTRRLCARAAAKRTRGKASRRRASGRKARAARARRCGARHSFRRFGRPARHYVSGATRGKRR